MCEKKSGAIRILHLSDLHVKEWSQSLEEEVNALVADINENFREIDFIVITGDVTFSGTISQFDVVAEKIFPRLRSAAHVSAKKFIIVPGNHDINRDLVSSCERQLPKNLLSGDTSPEEVIAEVAQSRIFEDYRNFILNTGAMKGANTANGFCSLVFPSSRSSIEKVSFACVNTAWSCLGDSNKGEIFITKKQLDFLREQIAVKSLKIAIMHHDIEWLHESESNI